MLKFIAMKNTKFLFVGEKQFRIFHEDYYNPDFSKQIRFFKFQKNTFLACMGLYVRIYKIKIISFVPL